MILSGLLAFLSFALGFHLRTQISKEKSTSIKPKSDIIRELNDFVARFRDFETEWRTIEKNQQLESIKIRDKYKGDLNQLNARIDKKRENDYQTRQKMIRKYEENYKPEAKRIKYESELFIEDYRKSETSYAEYDRVESSYDLEKLINDLDLLTTKVQLK